MTGLNLSQWQAYLPVALAGLVVWALWLYRVILSKRSRPVVNNFSTTTSVVVPSFHEDPDIPKDIRAFAHRAETLGVGQAVSFLRQVDAINQLGRPVNAGSVTVLDFAAAAAGLEVRVG